MADIPEIHDVTDEAAEQRRLARIERERAMLAVGMAQLDRGECLQEDELEAWLEQLETDADAPLPARVARERVMLSEA